MTTRRPLVIGNWKMNLDYVEALHLVQQLGVLMKNRPVEHTDVVVAAPFVDLRSVASIIDAERFAIALGAQHVNAQENGPHTGEVSTSMLKRLNVEWVLVGHSERRVHYFMSDEIVAETLVSVVRAGQHAVLCVGEELNVREHDEHEAYVAAQLESALGRLDEKFHDLVTVAYEPLWAIGTGVNATPEQARAMTAYLRAVLRSMSFGVARVLYGGSVNAENAATLVRESDVDGFLVGGASLKAESFYAILQACDDCYARKR
ncbi:MAG TPA: triose-phosphate isomerase [Acidimicrobiales bacterium]|nr:triose-phosphate isomerase [Acidimicrobiales bacterium]